MSGINHHTDGGSIVDNFGGSIVDNFETTIIDPLILDNNKFTMNANATSTTTASTPLTTFDAEKKKKPRKKRRNNVTKKPPDAPKRFKRYVLDNHTIHSQCTDTFYCIYVTELYYNGIILLTILLSLSLCCMLYVVYRIFIRSFCVFDDVRIIL
jgi:hypothetical protein